MSVRTSADEHLDKAKDAINEALKHLTEIVLNEVPGYDHYREEYADAIEDAHTQLRKIKKALK